MAAFLANVGVNAGHAARSRLAADGTFVVLPIPERGAWAPPMHRLAEPVLEDLARAAPPTWLQKPVHLDPDFRSRPATYGDNCRTAGRAYSLRTARPGDVIWFLARLHGQDPQPPAVHLVGRLEIDGVLADVTGDPGAGWWDGNAHVRRGRATQEWNSFWVFRGTAGSGWLRRAVPFGRRQAERLFGDWRWPDGASEQQVIAWHTRAVRRVDELALAEIVAGA